MKPVALLLLPALIVPLAAAVPKPDAPGDALAEPLVKVIAEVAPKDRPVANDYMRIADATLDFARRKSQSGEGFSRNVVESGLDAITAGEAMDTNAADWSTLRKELSAYLDRPKEEPPPKNQDQKDPPPEKSDEQKDQDQKGDGEKSDENKSGESQKSEDANDQSEKNRPSDEQNDQAPQNKPDQQGSDEKGSGEGDDEKRQPQGASAFGDMKNEERRPPPAEPSEKPSSEEPDTQQVGGQPKPENAGTAAQDPLLAMPLQKLEQLRQQDSPAKLFRLMDGPAGKEPAKKGKTW